MTKASNEKSQKDIDMWIDEIVPKHESLTKHVINIIENLLKENKIDHLAVTGRTKDKESIKEKIKRKSYNNPEKQLTDLSGIRVIMYFESDITRVSKIIRESFQVDIENSSSKQELLATDQIGYRSIHYVCDLGEQRVKLPEFKSLKGLKFEFQVRTVLQHAWAELAHDRNYKFSGKLPRAIERKLYLYAGMLEIADKGFDELASSIEEYRLESNKNTEKGELNIELNSITLSNFLSNYKKSIDFYISDFYNEKMDVELLKELNDFGINTLQGLQSIIPDNYEKFMLELDLSTTTYGMIRDWMLISDYVKLKEKSNPIWELELESRESLIFQKYLSKDKMKELFSLYDSDSDDDEISLHVETLF
ncbi:GTP pyrophosphokinase [Grimontia sp. NTOU-MAR1]|uniref:GTP pyrophosphokinase n=1 Tax=Grimontia sp. NTOU-MAR1 TaxID=3111011 RepID=UPI002DB5CDE2|nr:GTP pyrophosphokinase [Grimontia sp. NTOU-MAR1]WRV96507.1 GTP pyrophosphokinase [Grimontia sp. NTOU-MAR1]